MHSVFLDDDTFLQQFENQTLEAEYFNHIGHLRLAWLYLNRYSTAEANRHISKGIQAYINSLGISDKFHHTITGALVYIMAKRLQQAPYNSWTNFIQENRDLTVSALTVLSQYYSPALLFSDTAKAGFIDPDLQAF